MRAVLARVQIAYVVVVLTVKHVWKDFTADNGNQAAAAFSFFSFLSLIALLILAGAILGVVLKNDVQLRDQIVNYIAQNLPGLSKTIEDALTASVNLRGALGVTGVLGLLYMGTKVFDSFQIWLNTIWGADKPTYLKRKLKSLAIMLFLGAVIAVGFGVHMTLFIARRHLTFLGSIFSILAFLITALMLFVGLMFIYSYSVEIKLGWRVAWKGALFAALLVNPVQMALSWYYSDIGDFSVIYGSFASVVLTIIVIYYAGYIVYLGAELNRFLDFERPRPL